jgi:hypothetical protein
MTRAIQCCTPELFEMMPIMALALMLMCSLHPAHAQLLPPASVCASLSSVTGRFLDAANAVLLYR